MRIGGELAFDVRERSSVTVSVVGEGKDEVEADLSREKKTR